MDHHSLHPLLLACLLALGIRLFVLSVARRLVACIGRSAIVRTTDPYRPRRSKPGTDPLLLLCRRRLRRLVGENQRPDLAP
ncbi:hypothetical protein PF005_g27537 [Phytophthora fragariae]|uniref:Uncharacterized protein n=1 Tax=Phytophthora fragariae TaxID=53985 RepID=A0A6A3VQY0_9STRA|nr:hypothetical protein PF003_g789 [Phytophthora fragariae]KAE8921378.1 hypothetical protein PF009_g28345 [Phytophthora fragariae]KAE8970507.1 hypothetical protein PF011_g26389 [Phytophthora fragariae]KAE9068925.1 hypothetical protein PF010_g26867 [Phytophthora fragariae]KAE9069442.1 hypothetical protein PF007_g27317 [Phytophthora fragariae]